MFRIGRHPSNDFVIQDRAAEDFHCVLFHENGEAWIEDLQTRYGILVNGSRVKKILLHSGDILQIGFTRIAWDDLVAQSLVHSTAIDELPSQTEAELSSVAPHNQSIEETPQFQQEAIPNSTGYALLVSSNPYDDDIRADLLEKVHKQHINKETDIPEFIESKNDSKSKVSNAPIQEEFIQPAAESGAVKLDERFRFEEKLSFEQRMIRLTLALIVGMGLLGWLFGRVIQ